MSLAIERSSGDSSTSRSTPNSARSVRYRHVPLEACSSPAIAG
jgi:hypothetical protein